MSCRALVRVRIFNEIQIPCHNFSASLDQRLAEAGSFQKAVREQVRIARTPAIEPNVLQQVQEILHGEKKIYRLHLERIVKHFLNPLARKIDFQDIRIN